MKIHFIIVQQLFTVMRNLALKRKAGGFILDRIELHKK